MEQKKTLFVGLDLCNDNTQLSVYNEKTFEPETISRGGDNTFIPTVLFARRDTKEWFFGQAAIGMAPQEKGELVTDILKKIENKESFSIYGNTVTGTRILEKFLKKVLSLLKEYSPNDSIRKLVVTIPKMNVRLIKSVYEALSSLGVLKDRVQVISHEQAYLYYVLYQKKELWMNDVGMFLFDERGLSYHQISVNRKTTPMVAGVNHKDFSGTLSYDLLTEQGGPGAVDYVFENIAKSVLHKQILSTIYLTGKGFTGEWYKKVAEELCIGRRLFVGQNLFTQGACYGAKELFASEAGEERLGDFVFLSEEMVPCNIFIKAWYNASLLEIPLIKAGTPWYEADTFIGLIPDFEEELEITVKDVIKRTSASHMLLVGGIKGRPNRMTRLELHIRFSDTKTCIIKVRDKGFGDFFPTSNRVWEKTIHL